MPGMASGPAEPPQRIGRLILLLGLAAFAGALTSRVTDPFVAEAFGLTRAEAEVAAALAGGETANSVAAARGVTVGTVRAQVRVILAKVGAMNLREFEHILGLRPIVDSGGVDPLDSR